jgi:hypothetical protein
MKKLFNPAIKRAFIDAAKGSSSRSKVVRVVKQALGWTNNHTPVKK